MDSSRLEPQSTPSHNSKDAGPASDRSTTGDSRALPTFVPSSSFTPPKSSKDPMNIDFVTETVTIHRDLLHCLVKGGLVTTRQPLPNTDSSSYVYKVDPLEALIAERIRNRMTATEFVKKLLSFKPEDLARHDFLQDAQLKPDEQIHLFSTATKRYILKKHAHTFEHDGGMLISRLNLVCNDWNYAHDLGAREISRDKTQNAGMSTTLTLGTDLDLQKLEDTTIAVTFVSLGSLVEIPKGSTGDGGKLEHCTTNYVVLLNVSTKPMSLWLAYDYYTRNNEWQHASLFDIHNKSFCDGDDDHYHVDEGKYGFNAKLELPDAEKEALGALRDHIGLLNDFKAFKSMDILKETSPITSTAGIHNARINDNGNVQMDIFWEGILEPETTDESEPPNSVTPQSQPCFLDTPAPFDLAILATDVSRWNAETGLDADSVKYCLDNASWCLGASLHAKWAPSVEAYLVKPNKKSGAS